jgi:hypothetical protein
VAYLAVLIGLLVVTALVVPFFRGPGGQLQAGASVNSPARLRAMKDAVIERFLEDEQAAKNGDLSPLAWEKRKAFLSHRYIDAARRLDFVEHAHPEKSHA